MEDLTSALEQIPWHTLDTASGNSTHVPRALKGLLSNDASTRDIHYFQLANQ